MHSSLDDCSLNEDASISGQFRDREYILPRIIIIHVEIILENLTSLPSRDQQTS
jgi:hypothetical protein